MPPFLTTGKIAEGFRRHYPYVTRDMVNYDVQVGRLECYPQLGDGTWNRAIPEKVPDYLKAKQVPPDVVKDLLAF